MKKARLSKVLPIKTIFRWLGRQVRLYFSPGRWGERQAARFLSRQGLAILERNFRVRSGEVDLVALDRNALVFVEVKAVSPRSRSRGFDRLTPAKKRRLRRATRAYLARHRGKAERWRFDAVIIDFEQRRWRFRRVISLRWHKNIFDLEKFTPF
ncbi:MAG: YraN family protein [Planctomycetes bacterium]|nr:YraN family protein [Planctomycetota bacterium]